MTVKDFFRLVLVYIVLFLVGTALYLVSFRIPFVNMIDVFFYRGLIVIFACGVIVSIIMMILMKKPGYTGLITVRDVLLLFVMFVCVHVVVFTHLPVTADRSITVFMLGTMSDGSDRTYTEEQIEDIFTDKYVGDYGAFEKRFHEQVVTGTIEDTGDGKYRITDEGIKLMKIYEKTAWVYGLDDKLIHPGAE